MRWIALQWPPAEPDRLPDPVLAWWALAYTPHVTWLDEALLLEVSGCERLWDGARALLQRLLQESPASGSPCWAQGATSLLALARLRLRVAGVATRAIRPADLPLHTLSAARPHLPVLHRLGCRSWGQLDALPRAGLARRFGPGLNLTLDIALGRVPDVHAWVVAPERFEQSLELPQRADSASALSWAAARLLERLRQWLAARGLGVLALELVWTFDQSRLDGKTLPDRQSLVLRTAEATRDMSHLGRLLAGRLERTALQAPAREIHLRVLQVTGWNPASDSLLPQQRADGEPLLHFIERAGARLGAECLRVPVLRADHRPECRQDWLPAQQALARGAGRVPRAATGAGGGDVCPDALAPACLVRPARALVVRDGVPCHRGQPLELLAGPYRVETGWWPAAGAAPATRDCFVARGGAGTLLWVYRECVVSSERSEAPGPRWFLQGIYA